MKRLIETGMRNRFWVILVTILVCALGVYSTVELPIDAVPDITNVQVMINTKTGALAPEEIENSITFPIETELAGVPNREEIRSISKYGLSQVIVIFKEGTDLYFARQQITERLQNLRGRLPEGVVPVLGPVSTGLGEVMMYIVSAKPGTKLASMPDVDRLRYLRTFHDWTIRPILKSVPGVAEIDSNGGYEKAIFINVNPYQMEQYGVSMDRLHEALIDTGVNRGGGYMESDERRIITRITGRFDQIDQIRNIPIRFYALGDPIRLASIAGVREGNQPRLGAATFEGSETVLGTVLMRIGANSRTVSEEAAQKIKDLNLPDDIQIKILYSRSRLVNATISTVSRNLLEGGALVIIILFLILGNFRAAVIVSLAIPLSMLVSVTGMLHSGISANLMSLGAVDFGLLVDGSVVMIENIVRRMDESGKSSFSYHEKKQIVLDSAAEVAKPVFSGILVIIMVYIPILSLTGIEGKMFRPMAATVLFALSASLITAIVLMPVIAFLFLKTKGKHHESFLIRVTEKYYRPMLAFSLNHKLYILVPSLVAAILAFVIVTRMGMDFIPRLDEGDLVIGIVRRADISLEKSVAMQKESEKIIKSFPEVRTVFSRIGTPESDTDPMGVNFADTFVILKTPEELPAGYTPRKKEKLFNAIAEALKLGVPDQELSPTQPIEMRFNEMLEGSRADISVRVFGPDLKTLLELVTKTRKTLSEMSGVQGVGWDELTALRISPVIDYHVNHPRLSGFGMYAQALNRSFETAMAGRTVGYFYENVLRFPIILRLDDVYRNRVESVSRIPVELPGGGVMSLSGLADLQMRDQVTTIARVNSRRYASVAIYLGQRDVQSFVSEARQRIDRDVPLPAGYTIEWGGQFKNLEKARIRLLIIVPATLVVIFLILLRSFGSLRQTILIFNCIPFAMTGGIAFLFARGIPLSISAAVGFIALAGIAILNGTVLVSFFNELRSQGNNVRDAVFNGTLIRLRPVLMTALVASLGFVPMAFNTGPGSEVQRPLATVVIGGLVSATLLTLLLLPALYLWMEGGREDRLPVRFEEEQNMPDTARAEEIFVSTSDEDENPGGKKRRKKNNSR